MGVEGVRHRRHHDASDEDDHAEWHSAAVAGHLGAAGGRSQLDLIDVRDVRHDDTVLLPELLPVHLLSRDGRWDFHGALGDPSSAVGVVHGELTRKKEVGHLNSDVSQSQNS